MVKSEARRVRIRSLFIGLYRHPLLSESAWFLGVEEKSPEHVRIVSFEGSEPGRFLSFKQQVGPVQMMRAYQPCLGKNHPSLSSS